MWEKMVRRLLASLELVHDWELTLIPELGVMVACLKGDDGVRLSTEQARELALAIIERAGSIDVPTRTH